MGGKLVMEYVDGKRETHTSKRKEELLKACLFGQ